MDKAYCVQCDVEINHDIIAKNGVLFNEIEDVFYCDKQCYDEWASDNVEKVSEYYYRMNVDY